MLADTDDRQAGVVYDVPRREGESMLAYGVAERVDEDARERETKGVSDAEPSQDR